MDLVVITLKTIFFYFFILISYRIMGKREIGQLGTTDLIVSILIAELVAISIKSKFVRNFLDGKPTMIIKNGQINYKEMVKARYSIDDLLFQLRQNSIKSIEEIEYALLETNGKLSIFPYNPLKLKSSYPMALIIDGIIQDDTLTNIKKNKDWLLHHLEKKNLKPEDIFYAFYKRNSVYLIKKSDIK